MALQFIHFFKIKKNTVLSEVKAAHQSTTRTLSTTEDYGVLGMVKKQCIKSSLQSEPAELTKTILQHCTIRGMEQQFQQSAW